MFFIAGLILLVKGSTYLVKSSSSIAKKFGVSEFVIGLTLVAIGTSLPELLSSIMASVRGESGLIVGTIIGANISNLALVVGIAATISQIRIKKDVLNRDSYVLLLSLILLIFFILNNSLTRIEGLIFLLVYFAYLTFIFQSNGKVGKKYGFEEFIPYFFKFKYIITIRSSLIRRSKENISYGQKKKIKKTFKEGLVKDFLILSISLIAVLMGANLLVEQAVYFAEIFTLPKFFIGILISLGTTMPEMAVSITASKKGFGNIAIGNAVGSFITNTFLILGISSIISPINILETNLKFALTTLSLFSVLFFIFIRTERKLSKIEGIILLIIYAAFLTWTTLSYL